MNKKVAISIPVLIVVIVAALVAALIMNNDNGKLTDPNNNNNQGETTMGKTAVVYFSRTNNTEKIAKMIAKQTNSDIYEIEAKVSYTDEDIDWTVSDSRANREQNDATARPEIASIPDISSYDMIYLGYPIWWGTLPKIMNTFIETKALEGKKIAAFCTSGSSGIGTSVSALRSYDLDVIGSQRFSASASENEVEIWLKEL